MTNTKKSALERANRHKEIRELLPQFEKDCELEAAKHEALAESALSRGSNEEFFEHKKLSMAAKNRPGELREEMLANHYTTQELAQEWNDFITEEEQRGEVYEAAKRIFEAREALKAEIFAYGKIRDKLNEKRNAYVKHFGFLKAYSLRLVPCLSPNLSKIPYSTRTSQDLVAPNGRPFTIPVGDPVRNEGDVMEK